MDKVKKLAVLIDADNSSYQQIPLVLQEIAKYGIASVKRIYGDWSSQNLQSWREVLLPHAITPIQQFAYTKGKDATDMMLIINAMDLLYSGALDGFCIVSGDSDFTPLASRIRESGLMVYGFGKQNTPNAFINACDKFIYIENLIDSNSDNDELNSIIESKSDKIDNTTQKPVATPNQEIKVDDQTLQLIYKAIKDIADDDGFANLADLGKHLAVLRPDFDTRTYGRAKLSGLLQALDLFEIEERGSQKFVRRKKKVFSEFLKILEKVMKNHYGVGKFAKIDILAKWVRYDGYVSADEYGFDTIANMLKNINSKYFELNDDKTQIRLLK